MGPRSLFFGPPVLADEAIFFGHREHEIVKLNHKLVCQRRTPAEGFEPFGAVGDVIVLRGPAVCRAERSSGDRLWSQPVLARNWWLWRDKVLVVDPGVAFLDVATGHREELDLGAVVGAAVGDVFLFTSVDDPGVVRAYDLIERRHLWHDNLHAAVRSHFGLPPDERMSKVPGGGRRFISAYGDNVLCFSMDNGTPLWCAPGFVPYGVPAVQNGRVYAWTCDRAADYEGHLLCLDEVSGDVVYRRPMRSYGLPDIGANMNIGVLADDHIVFSTRMGALLVFRLADGELVWSYRHARELHWPVVAGHRVVVTSSDGYLYAFDLAPESRDERHGTSFPG